MNHKKIFLYLCLVLSFLFLSCDEFEPLLKKTVTVRSISGEITYDPADQNLSGILDYDIKNPQTNALNEIYFIFHSSVSIDFAQYKNNTVRFEQGIGYGYGICRLKISSPMPSGESETIQIRFHIKGPIEEDRFVLSENNVFIDSEKIWLPVPFTAYPQFKYQLKVKTPEKFYSVLGGKLVDESVKDEKRVCTWKSETDDAVLSGNIFISKYLRLSNQNVFLYSIDTNNSTRIFRYVSQILNTFTNRCAAYPYSQIHIVNQVFQYKDMDELIDGEASANIIQITPEINTTNFVPDESVRYSPIPDIPRNSGWKLFEILAHEMSHAYVRGILKFDENSYTESESMAEFSGLSVISFYQKDVYKKYIDRNRVELINLMLAKQQNSRQMKYLYGVNCLSSAFGTNTTYFLDYLKMLIEKYRFTEVSQNDLITTASELQDQLRHEAETNKAAFKNFDISNTINVPSLRLWKHYELYNLGLTYTNVQITNQEGRRKVIENRRLVTVENKFPIDIDAQLIEYYGGSLLTNHIILPKNSETNLLYKKNIESIEIKSPYTSLEKKLSDNKLNFYQSRWDPVMESLNRFYKGENTPRNIQISDSKVQDAGWKNLLDDRSKSKEISPQIELSLDKVTESDGEFAIAAYKNLADKPFSYVIIKGRMTGSTYKFISIIDPFL